MQWILTFLGVTALGCSVSFGVESAKPSIVFVLADDLGWGDLACYGNLMCKTPRLDRMAEEGKLFQQFYMAASLCSTALPNGTAIPHPRQPMPYVSAEPLICVARVPGGIAFGAPKGELTRVFFLICCHTDRYHLHALARLMRILDDETVDRLLDAESGEELLQVLISKEAKVVALTK